MRRFTAPWTVEAIAGGFKIMNARRTCGAGFLLVHDFDAERAPVSLSITRELRWRGAMFFRSLFWERTVLSLLEDVQALPPNVQADYAKRVSGYIERASTTDGVGALERFAAAAVEERAQVIAQGIKSKLDQRWVVPALAEAWCVARFALYNGSLSRESAMAVIAAIEAFALKRPACLTTA